jgi:hypothetical protein
MSDDERVIGEARWPSAAAVLAAMVLTILLPDAVRIGPNWMLPVVEGILLIALIVGDPGAKAVDAASGPAFGHFTGCTSWRAQPRLDAGKIGAEEVFHRAKQDDKRDDDPAQLARQVGELQVDRTLL